MSIVNNSFAITTIHEIHDEQIVNQRALDNQYFDLSTGNWERKGLLERILRAVGSFFCCFIDSSADSCKRKTLASILKAYQIILKKPETLDVVKNTTDLEWQDAGDRTWRKLSQKVQQVKIALGQLKGMADIRQKAMKEKSRQTTEHATTTSTANSLTPSSPSPAAVSTITSQLQTPPLLQKIDYAALWQRLENKTAQMKFDFLEQSSKKQEVDHRFSDIPCPRDSAIPYGPNKFLHANKITPDLVASQAPKQSEMNPFWSEVHWGTYFIVDLTNESDLSRSDNPVTPYYPQKPGRTNSVKFGSMEIILENEKNGLSTYHVVDSTISNNIKWKIIYRYHFPKWPDHGVVSVENLDKLVNAVEIESKTDANHNSDPLWVHCRAGVGRTGTFAVARAICSAIRRGKETMANAPQIKISASAPGVMTKENLSAALEEIILNYRQKRGPNFVQTPEQFKLLHQYAEYLLGK